MSETPLLSWFWGVENTVRGNWTHNPSWKSKTLWKNNFWYQTSPCRTPVHTLFFLHILTDQVSLHHHLSTCVVQRSFENAHNETHWQGHGCCIWATLLWRSKIPQGKELRAYITTSILISQGFSETCSMPWSLRIERCNQFILLTER